MKSEILEEIIEKVDLLTTEEQLSLIDVITRKTRSSVRLSGGPRTWLDLKGMLSYPACGEDAQSYISRSRQESDEKRLTDAGR